MIDVRPYSDELVMRMASSKVSKGVTVTDVKLACKEQETYATVVRYTYSTKHFLLSNPHVLFHISKQGHGGEEPLFAFGIRRQLRLSSNSRPFLLTQRNIIENALLLSLGNLWSNMRFRI